MASQVALNTLNKEVANYGLLFVKLHILKFKYISLKLFHL